MYRAVVSGNDIEIVEGDVADLRRISVVLWFLVQCLGNQTYRYHITFIQCSSKIPFCSFSEYVDKTSIYLSQRAKIVKRAVMAEQSGVIFMSKVLHQRNEELALALFLYGSREDSLVYLSK